MKKISAALCALVFALSLAAQEDPSGIKFTRSKKLKIRLTSTSTEAFGAQKKDNLFMAGEIIYINIEVDGVEAGEDKKVRVQADLSIPEFGFDKKNLINEEAEATDPVQLYFKVPYGSVIKNTVCNPKIIIRDMVAHTFAEFSLSIKLSKEK